MRKTLCIFLFTVFTLISIFSQSALAQSDYICDCAADTLSCSDFASPSDAQACFWYCGALGAGDIHQLDLDMNAVACDVIAQPIAIPTPEPVYVEPTVTPIPEPVYVAPTAVPAYEVCSCGGDYYDCSTFSGPSHAQGCYDYCAGQGLGDVHLMDPDNDGLACLASGPVFAVPVPVVPTATPVPYVPPTAVYVAPVPYVPPTVASVYVAPALAVTAVPYVLPTAVPVYVAPTEVPAVYILPTTAPIAAAPTSTPIPYTSGLDVYGKVASPEFCACDSDHYNCDSFSNQEDATACATYCNDLGYGDIHRLDQGGIEGVICEAHFESDSIPFDTMEVPDAVCDCSDDIYNCSSFATQLEAQGCFNYCYSLGYGDIHGIDGRDSDLLACESLPGTLP